MGRRHRGLITLVFLTSVLTGEALKCYECTTECGDPFDVTVSGVTMEPCLYCQKIKTYRSGSRSSVDVERHCILPTGGVIKPPNKCVTSGDTIECTCDTDTCNTGAITTRAMATSVFSFIALTILNKF